MPPTLSARLNSVSTRPGKAEDKTRFPERFRRADYFSGSRLSGSRMKKITLEQVQKLASQLSPEERQQLFLFLAELPDSKVRVSVEGSLRNVLAPAERKKFNAAAKTDEMYVLSDGKFAAVFQRGRLIFQVLFYANNFLRSR